MVLTRCRIVRSCASEYGIGSRLLIALSSVLRVRVRSSCSNVSGNRMAGQPALRRRFEPMDRLTLYGSFTSSSSYKPMLYLALARLPFSFRTINLKTGVQKSPEYLAINRDSRLSGARDWTFRGQDRTGALAGARMAFLGSRSHHPSRQGSALGAVSPLSPRDDRRVSPARRSSTILCRQDRRELAVAGAAWFSWPKAASTSPTGPILRRGRDASKRCPGSRSPMS